MKFSILPHTIKQTREIILKHLTILFVGLIFGEIHFHELIPLYAKVYLSQIKKLLA